MSFILASIKSLLSSARGSSSSPAPIRENSHTNNRDECDGDLTALRRHTYSPSTEVEHPFQKWRRNTTDSSWIKSASEYRTNQIQQAVDQFDENFEKFRSNSRARAIDNTRLCLEQVLGSDNDLQSSSTSSSPPNGPQQRHNNLISRRMHFLMPDDDNDNDSVFESPPPSSPVIPPVDSISGIASMSRNKTSSRPNLLASGVSDSEVRMLTQEVLDSGSDSVSSNQSTVLSPRRKIGVGQQNKPTLNVAKNSTAPSASRFKTLSVTEPVQIAATNTMIPLSSSVVEMPNLPVMDTETKLLSPAKQADFDAAKKRMDDYLAAQKPNLAVIGSRFTTKPVRALKPVTKITVTSAPEISATTSTSDTNVGSSSSVLKADPLNLGIGNNTLSGFSSNVVTEHNQQTESSNVGRFTTTRVTIESEPLPTVDTVIRQPAEFSSDQKTTDVVSECNQQIDSSNNANKPSAIGRFTTTRVTIGSEPQPTPTTVIEEPAESLSDESTTSDARPISVCHFEVSESVVEPTENLSSVSSINVQTPAGAALLGLMVAEARLKGRSCTEVDTLAWTNLFSKCDVAKTEEIAQGSGTTTASPADIVPSDTISQEMTTSEVFESELLSDEVSFDTILMETVTSKTALAESLQLKTVPSVTESKEMIPTDAVSSEPCQSQAIPSEAVPSNTISSDEVTPVPSQPPTSEPTPNVPVVTEPTPSTPIVTADPVAKELSPAKNDDLLAAQKRMEAYLAKIRTNNSAVSRFSKPTATLATETSSAVAQETSTVTSEVTQPNAPPAAVTEATENQDRAETDSANLPAHSDAVSIVSSEAPEQPKEESLKSTSTAEVEASSVISVTAPLRAPVPMKVPVPAGCLAPTPTPVSSPLVTQIPVVVPTLAPIPPAVSGQVPVQDPPQTVAPVPARLSVSVTAPINTPRTPNATTVTIVAPINTHSSSSENEEMRRPRLVSPEPRREENEEEQEFFPPSMTNIVPENYRQRAAVPFPYTVNDLAQGLNQIFSRNNQMPCVPTFAGVNPAQQRPLSMYRYLPPLFDEFITHSYGVIGEDLVKILEKLVEENPALLKNQPNNTADLDRSLSPTNMQLYYATANSPKKSAVRELGLFPYVPEWFEHATTACSSPIKGIAFDKDMRPEPPVITKEMKQNRYRGPPIRLVFPKPAKKLVKWGNESQKLRQEKVVEEQLDEDNVDKGYSGFRILSVVDNTSNNIHAGDASDEDQ